MHMPDAADPNISVLHVIVAFTFVVAAARYMMPSPSSFAVEFGDVMLGSVALAVVIYFFGGSTSPAVPIVLFILLYIGWFMPLRTVVPVSVMALVMMLIPTVIGPQSEISLMDAVTVYGGIAVTSTLLVVLYYNHYYIDRARALTMHLARIDPRTGSNNRRAFELRLAEELEQLSFGDRDALAVVLIDLGTSKNLTAGHARTVRDQLLTETAQALVAASRDQDLVARLGGDEFVIVAPGVDAESARALAQRLTTAVHEALTASEAPLASEVLPSAGFALYGMHGRTTDELLAAADIALTTAKTSGRDPERVSSFVVSL
jgi:diguanylate cyclase (GGDEF)-like protein